MEEKEIQEPKEIEPKEAKKALLPKFKKISWNIKTIAILCLIVVVLICIIIGLVRRHQAGDIAYQAKNTFIKAVDSDELRTAVFTYNSVAVKCQEECKGDDTDEHLYYVAYEGDVTAGLDFSKISFEVDKQNKKLKIIMPEVTITKTHAYVDSFKFIFNNSEYNSVNEINEISRLCNEDLAKKTGEDEEILNTAKENAKVVIEQFFAIWLKNYYSDYSLEIV